MIQITVIQLVRTQENVEENENNVEEIMENINKEEFEETRIMRLRFEEIKHFVTASTKENIEERLMKLKKVVVIAEIDGEIKYWRNKQ